MSFIFIPTFTISSVLHSKFPFDMTFPFPEVFFLKYVMLSSYAGDVCRRNFLFYIHFEKYFLWASYSRLRNFFSPSALLVYESMILWLA